MLPGARAQALWSGTPWMSICTEPSSCPASPLSLAERLHGPEPGSEVVLGGNAVIVAGRLEQLDLGDHFEFLGPEGRTGLRWLWWGGWVWPAWGGQSWESWVPRAPPQKVLDSALLSQPPGGEVPPSFCIQCHYIHIMEGGEQSVPHSWVSGPCP